jgi:isopenicillin-N epimerase
MEFDWVGTCDPTAYLAVPDALRFMGSLLEGGWPEVFRRNHELALRARDLLCEALNVPPAAPDDMIGSLAALPLPPGSGAPPRSALYTDPLQDELLLREGIEVPIFPWPASPQRLVRISAQLYNDVTQFEKLAAALPRALAAERA